MKLQVDSNLKTGDLIFARRNGILSKLIRWVTNSEWSHVAIYLGEGQVIDTDAFRRVGIHSLGDFEEGFALRFEGLTDSQVNAIVTYMIGQLNKPYDYRQIFGFFMEHVFGWENSWQKEGHFTCSALVDMAFMRAGIDLVPERLGGDVTPEDVFQSSSLRAIGEVCTLCYNM